MHFISSTEFQLIWFIPIYTHTISSKMTPFPVRRSNKLFGDNQNHLDLNTHTDYFFVGRTC